MHSTPGHAVDQHLRHPIHTQGRNADAYIEVEESLGHGGDVPVITGGGTDQPDFSNRVVSGLPVAAAGLPPLASADTEDLSPLWQRTDVAEAGSGWAYLVSGENDGGEGPLGSASTGEPRLNLWPCS